MTTDINNFICIFRQKNGQVKIKHNNINVGNIYMFLRDLGFRKSKLDNRRIYYRRNNTELETVHPREIKQAFLDFLKRADYTDLPDDINHNDILEWYYSKMPIKESGLNDHYLEDNLTEQEIHSLRLQTNHDYKHKFDINQLIAKFDELHFSKTVDSINSYSSNNPPLYYKSVGDRKYLVFNHWNCNSKFKDGFDGWIATYKNEKQIGKKKPNDLQEVCLGFLLDRDFPLIEQYLISELPA